MRYLCDLRAPKKREYGVDLLVDPAEFAPQSITNVRFMVHVDGNRFFFNIDEFQGGQCSICRHSSDTDTLFSLNLSKAEVPEDLQQLPEAWSVRFEEKYLQRLSGLRSNQSLEGMTRANHELMQEWIRRFVVQVRKANHRYVPLSERNPVRLNCTGFSRIDANPTLGIYRNFQKLMSLCKSIQLTEEVSLTTLLLSFSDKPSYASTISYVQWRQSVPPSC